MVQIEEEKPAVQWSQSMMADPIPEGADDIPDDPPPACVRSVSNTTPPGWRDRPCPDPFPYVCDGPG